jgi:predicted ribosome quality control (RQC) complex YloA/Tae2 family protein
MNEHGVGDHAGDDFLREIARLRRIVKKALERERSTLAKQKNELDDASRELWYRQIGDSLLADVKTFPRGSSEADIVNIHTGATERVHLNPALDARENAELLYKKARKAHRGADIIASNIKNTETQITGLEKLFSECQIAAPPEGPAEAPEDAVQRLTRACQEAGLIRSPAPKAGPQEEPRVPYRHIRIDDYHIYIGRNDAQNDELTTRFTRPWDIWLHVAAHAGSHVVIRRDKNAPWPPQMIIEQAAQLAVWFSKAKHTSYAEVHVTEGRFVRKRRHAPPGEVIAERCKTVRVSPRSPQEMFRDLPEMHDDD